MSKIMTRKEKKVLMQRLCTQIKMRCVSIATCSVVNDLTPDRISMMRRGRLSPEFPISYVYWHLGRYQ